MKLLAVCLLVVAAGCGLVAAGASPARQPVLRIASTKPLVIRGEGFRAHENITLFVTAPGATRFSVRATAAGILVVRTALRPARCDSVVVQAVGKSGSRAMVDRTVPSDCRDADGPLPQ